VDLDQIMVNSKGDATVATSTIEALEAIRVLQQNFQKTETCLKQFKEAGKLFGDTEKKMDEKLQAPQIVEHKHRDEKWPKISTFVQPFPHTTST
jgi:hypothetical protein